MEIVDYLKILQARWRIVAAVTVLGILGALGASLLSTPVYQPRRGCSFRRRRVPRSTRHCRAVNFHSSEFCPTQNS